MKILSDKNKLSELEKEVFCDNKRLDAIITG